MNSYAAAVGNMQIAAQEYERRCQEFELRARNARILAERNATSEPTMSAPAGRGIGVALTAALGRAFAHVAGRHALAR